MVVPKETHAVEEDAIVLPPPTPYVVGMEVLIVALEARVVELAVVPMGQPVIKVNATGCLVQNLSKFRSWPDLKHTTVKSCRG